MTVTAARRKWGQTPCCVTVFVMATTIRGRAFLRFLPFFAFHVKLSWVFLLNKSQNAKTVFGVTDSPSQLIHQQSGPGGRETGGVVCAPPLWRISMLSSQTGHPAAQGLQQQHHSPAAAHTKPRHALINKLISLAASCARQHRRSFKIQNLTQILWSS